MKKDRFFSKLTLLLILYLIVMSLINSDNLKADSISEEIMAEYNSLLENSKTALKERMDFKSNIKMNFEGGNLL